MCGNSIEIDFRQHASYTWFLLGVLVLMAMTYTFPWTSTWVFQLGRLIPRNYPDEAPSDGPPAVRRRQPKLWTVVRAAGVSLCYFVGLSRGSTQSVASGAQRAPKVLSSDDRSTREPV